MSSTIGRILFRGYVVLLLTAVGGFVAANAAAMIATVFVVSENKASEVGPWMHGGWYVGTILAFVGAISGRFRFVSGAKGGQTKRAEGADDAEAINIEVETTADSTEPDESKRSSVVGAAGGLGLIGGFLGAIAGGSLLVVWFWLVYSPFSPEDWVSSVRIERERVTPSAAETAVTKSDHPIAYYLVGVPVAVGVLAGVIGGGIGAAMGKVRDG